MRTANPDQRPRVRRQRTWNVGSDPQAQFENRTGIKFLPLRPPVGPDKNVPKHSSFCAPEIPCPPKGVTHVNGVQGDANMGACAHFERPPGASLVSFWAPRKKLAVRDMSRKNKNFPGGEIWPRPCLKIGNVPDGEGFFRQTRRFDAAILCVLQGKSTQYGGKRPAVWAY